MFDAILEFLASEKAEDYIRAYYSDRIDETVYGNENREKIAAQYKNG